VGTGLRPSVRLGASGRVVTGFDIARLLALGADWCNAARGFMFALGCIQAQACHTDRCPTGVSTQNLWRQRALVVDRHRSHVTRSRAFAGSGPPKARRLHSWSASARRRRRCLRRAPPIPTLRQFGDLAQGRLQLRIPCVPCGLLATRRVFKTSAVTADNSSDCSAADRSTGRRARTVV
jgi:glutamate synthase-like protein